MATNTEKSRSLTKPKMVSFSIEENIMTKRFMIKTVKSMSQSSAYSQDIVFNSPLGDSMVMKLKCENNNLITISEGETGQAIVISGEHDTVHKFVHEFTVEALSLLATEISLCLKEVFPSISKDNLLESFREKLHKAIEGSILECSSN